MSIMQKRGHFKYRSVSTLSSLNVAKVNPGSPAPPAGVCLAW